jgi:hypothetical protein
MKNIVLNSVALLIIFFAFKSNAAADDFMLVSIAKNASDHKDFCKPNGPVRKLEGIYCSLSETIAAYVLAVCGDRIPDDGFTNSGCGTKAANKLQLKTPYRDGNINVGNRVRHLLRMNQDDREVLCRPLKGTEYHDRQC